MITPSRVHAAHERRRVLVIPASEAGNADLRHGIPERIREDIVYRARATVVEAVSRGEMRWLDDSHDTATLAQEAPRTWQRARSGPVATMQLRQGAKGRYVPTSQRERVMISSTKE
jgi:hypothetical protein